MTNLTILDAARRHFRHVAGSPHFTREAREEALKLEREVSERIGELIHAEAVANASAATE